MAFMIPAYTNEPFWLVETNEGTEAIPSSVVGPDGTLEPFLSGTVEGEPELVEGSWWCRLSAPGYMDATDWSGPFESEAEARTHIEETYDVDSVTGDTLEP